MKVRIARFFLMLTVCLNYHDIMLFAEDEIRRIEISAYPAVSVPLPPDDNLFIIAGGTGASIRYIFQSFRPISSGLDLSYQLAPIHHGDLGSLGSLSVISASITPQIQHTLWNFIPLSASAGAGYFFAFMNGDPTSYASNITWWGRLGIGINISPNWFVGIHGEYRKYESLYHVANIGVMAGAGVR